MAYRLPANMPTPLPREPHDHAGTERRSIFSRQRLQGFGEIACGDAFQVEPGDQFVDGLAASQIGQQDRRGELDAILLLGGIISHPWLLDLQPARSGKNLPRRKVAIANHQSLPLPITPLGMLGQEVVHFHLDG